MHRVGPERGVDVEGGVYIRAGGINADKLFTDLLVRLAFSSERPM